MVEEEEEYEILDYTGMCKRHGISPTQLTYLERYGMKDPVRDKKFKVKKRKV